MIPKIIHYCWVGGNPLPKSAKKCIKSWKKYCPDYKIIEWNESNYDFTKNQYMKEAFEAKKWGFVPDYARLDIIYEYGGVYLDVDVEIIKPLDSLLNYSGFAGFESNRFIALGLGFGAEPKNEIIKKLKDDYEQLHFLNDDGTYSYVASPHINTKTLEENGVKINGELQFIENFAFLPKEYLCPKNFVTGEMTKTKNTLSIHHYDGSWCPDDLKAKIDKQKKVYKKRKRWDMRDHILHIPNRVAIRILGEQTYERIKKVLKRL